MTTLDQLNQANRAEFTAALGHLFEHSPWVADETWLRRPFRDAAHLEVELCATMRAASDERKLTLIRAHPDLAGRLALAGKLTAESTREQASVKFDQMSAAELAAFQELNETYRKKFGFPFVICARLNAREAILSAMNSRIVNPPSEEFAIALAEIEKIARLRLADWLKPNFRAKPAN